MGIIHHSHQRACHCFSKIVRRYAAAQHQICFHRMSHCLMCQHSGKLAADNTGFLSCVRVYALPLLHKFLIQFIYFGEQESRIGKYRIKGTQSAHRHKQFHRIAGRGICGKPQIYITAGHNHVPVITLRYAKQLLHGIRPNAHASAGETGTFLHNICIQCLCKINIGFLFGIAVCNLPHNLPSANRRQSRCTLCDTLIHKHSVFRCRSQNCRNSIIVILCR